MTRKHPTDPDPQFLMRADESAQHAWSDAVKSFVSDPKEGMLLTGALKHPFLRHLMELHLNNSVTSIGAIILIKRGFAGINEFRARESWCRGVELGTIDLKEAGRDYFRELGKRCGEAPWFSTLVAGVTGYACRDAGEGICLGHEHLTTAIENHDTEILRRLVDPKTIDYCFEEMDESHIFTDEARLATEEYWSPYFSGRSSAKVFTSIFEYSRPSWSPEDAGDVFDAEHELFMETLNIG